MNTTYDIKPSVHIHEANANPFHLSEICAGLEEEGIPYSIFKANGDAVYLATEAASRSKLRVGIGITTKSAMLQTRNNPIDIQTSDITGDGQDPILYIDLSDSTANSKCRALGTNAARAVKGGIFI